MSSKEYLTATVFTVKSQPNSILLSPSPPPKKNKKVGVGNHELYLLLLSLSPFSDTHIDIETTIK